jgi:hypothetical protein
MAKVDALVYFISSKRTLLDSKAILELSDPKKIDPSVIVLADI